MNIQTGYYGIPGKNGGQTHIVIDGKPACGQRLHSKSEFQCCAAGIYRPYVECKRCLERLERVTQKHIENELRILLSA